MMNRTYSSELVNKLGEEVRICGFVDTIRKMGKLTFIDLSDSKGMVQVVFWKLETEVTEQSSVEIVGLVKEREEKNKNPNLPTGNFEIDGKSIKVYSKSPALPFPITDDNGYTIDDSLRLEFRYLDLRRERLQKNIRLRSLIQKKFRDFLEKEGFTEIETPLLTRSTPEGARDFLVPSRSQKGKFFALPQSPQQYKQLLMCSAFDRYFQFARCLRDEDLRSDRAYEHTQLDMEMSFMNKNEIMLLIETMFTDVLTSCGFSLKSTPFPVFSYEDAIKQFGADKFDLRNEEEKSNNVLAFAWVTDMPLFELNSQNKITFSHNPFTSPMAEDIDDVMNEINLLDKKSMQYDLVCNGFELGSGSIRITDPKLLKQIFKIMGTPEEQIETNIGHMLKAFEFGVPPHGGIGLGFDRIMSILNNETSIKEVIAFPQSNSGTTSVMLSPTLIPSKTIEELGLKTILSE